MIKPITFSTTILLKENNTYPQKQTVNTDQNSMTEFPRGYGSANIAFCSRNRGRHNNKVKIEEFLRLAEKGEQKPKYIPDLPVLRPYAPAVLDAAKCLAANGTCIVAHNPEIDSKEIFTSNLRSFIDTNQITAVGLDRETPFIYLNLNDYVDDTSKAVQEMYKDINKQLSKGKKTPVLLIDGLKGFLERIERPHEFGQISIFKKYPTVLFAEEGFNILSTDDAKTFNLGFTPESERDPKEFFYEEKFWHLLSKMTFLNRSKLIELPSISTSDAVDYLNDKLVQQHLLTKRNNIGFDEGCIEFALQLSKSMSYFQNHYFNAKHRARLMESDTMPINFTIENLKRAAMMKLIRYPKATSVAIQDFTEALPADTNWFKLLLDFNKLEETIKNSEAEQEKKKEEKKIGEEKTEPKNPEETPPENNDEVKQNKETDTTTKKEEMSGNFEVVQNPQTRFTDIGGMYNIKKQLQEEFLDILKNPKVKNSQKPSGILLSGPPGCGKTLLARAIAGEANVPFISTAGSSFIEMYVGVGPKRVRELYAKAKEEAKNHPSKIAIVFIDEVDAVAGNRKNGGGSEDLRTINALLHEMDGANNKDEQDTKIITIVATNYEGMIDEAFKRSGRIDLKYKIDDPRFSVKAREEILKIHSKDLTFKNDEEKKKIIHALAQTTSGLSGADLAELLKKANRMSLRVNRQDEYITEEDIQEAKMQVQAGVKTDMEHTDFELKQTVAHEAGHAVNSMILEKIFKNEQNKHKMPARILDFITNSARGEALGATYFKPSEENKMGSKETNLSDLIVLYGGYAIESLLFDTHSAGVSGDLKTATEIIENSVSKYDFGSEKHYLALNSDLMKNLFNQEMKEDIIKFAKKGMSIAKEIIDFARPFIEEYVQDLLSDKGNLDRTISSEEFKEKFQTWVTKHKKGKSYNALCKSVKQQIDDFCKEKGEEKTPIGFASHQ